MADISGSEGFDVLGNSINIMKREILCAESASSKKKMKKPLKKLIKKRKSGVLCCRRSIFYFRFFPELLFVYMTHFSFYKSLPYINKHHTQKFFFNNNKIISQFDYSSFSVLYQHRRKYFTKKQKKT